MGNLNLKNFDFGYWGYTYEEYTIYILSDPESGKYIYSIPQTGSKIRIRKFFFQDLPNGFSPISMGTRHRVARIGANCLGIMFPRDDIFPRF